MRKLRDYDSELKALDDRTRVLKQRKVQQLGELVIACGADALELDVLAGALLSAASVDPATKEGWRQIGEGFFRDRRRSVARGPHSRARNAPPVVDRAQSAAGEANAQ